MITRFLDWLDESAAGVIRVAYLLAGMIAVASYFSDGNVPRGLTHTLDAVLPWTLAAALEIHTYLTARRVRGAWQDMQAATLGSDEHERAAGVMRVNLGILAGLLAFSMYNQLQYLAITWKPPHTPLTPPGPFAYLIRATITPAAFMAAAFLAPMGEGMAVQVRAEAHHLARLAFKAASAQWKRRLRDMQRQGEDVTGALVQLVDDPTERRVIASIHAAMHPAPAALVAARTESPAESFPRTPEPPTSGRPLWLPREEGTDTPAESFREQTDHAPLRVISGARAHRESVRQNRSRKEQLRPMAYAALDEDPTLTRRELRNRLRCQQQTANALYAAWKLDRRQQTARRA